MKSTALSIPVKYRPLWDLKIIEKQIAIAMAKMFGFMALGLFITGYTAYKMASLEWLEIKIKNNFVLLDYSFFTLFLGALIILFLLYVVTEFEKKINFLTAFIWYLLFCLSMGIFLTHWFIIYELCSLIDVFVITNIIFLTMAIYGLITKKNLTKIGIVCHIIFYGSAIFGFINIFFASLIVSTIRAFIGIIIFAILTAADIQRAKDELYIAIQKGESSNNKIALFAALEMYANYFCIFHNFLKVRGKKKNKN